MFESLASLNSPVAIYHFHLLNRLDGIETSLLESPIPPETALAHIRAAKAIRERFLRRDPPRWNVITLVRDPVARNLSSFFYNIEDYIPDFRSRSNSLSTATLRDVFLEQYVHDSALTWFDEQFTDVFEFDPLTTPFPAAGGYQIQNTERLDLLLMRTEDLKRHFSAAIARFLGIPDLALEPANAGTQKPYGLAYRQFLTEVIMPERYLDLMYESKLARHFYRPTEIEQFRRSWSIVEHRQTSSA